MLRDIFRFYQQSPITVLFIGISVFISLITWFGSVSSVVIWLIYDTETIINGQIWRLITPIFLHFPAWGIILSHLAFNMIWLGLFGNKIEQYESSRFLLVLIIVAASISNITQGLLSLGIFGGMSGVVYALLGYLFTKGKIKPNYSGKIPDNLAYFLIGFMVLSMTGLIGSNIANSAHVSGFCVGVLFAFIRTKR